MPAKKQSAALRIDLARARAHWHHKQGLAAPLRAGTASAIAEVLAATGWARTLGGVDVYLVLRARIEGLTRAAVDEAVSSRAVQVLPAARGCIYLVPHAHAALALAMAEELTSARTERELEKVGVSEKEIRELASAVVGALEKGPLTADGIRKALPEGSVRSLGERGKKAGMSSPLPSALRVLEFEGTIERTLEGGRLDTERYAWRRALKRRATPLPAVNERHARVASVFFGMAGPATLKDFAAWSGLSQRDARTAVEHAPLLPVSVDGYADETFVLDSDLPVLRDVPASSAAGVAFLPFEDNLVVVHGGPALLLDPAHHALRVPVWGGAAKEARLGDVKHLSLRSLVAPDGALVGAWEFDPDAEKVVFAGFGRLAAKQRREVERAAAELGQFVTAQLGHAKSFSLDTIDALRERAAFVRSLASR